MKIAIPIINKNDSKYKINDKFGRCRFFYVYDIDNNSNSIIDNDDNIRSAHGSGVQTSSMLAQNGIGAVIVKQIGPKAQDILLKSNIKIYEYKDYNNINDLIEMYKNNQLKEL